MLDRHGQEGDEAAGRCEGVEGVVQANQGPCKLPEVDTEHAVEPHLQGEEHDNLDRYGEAVAL